MNEKGLMTREEGRDLESWGPFGSVPFGGLLDELFAPARAIAAPRGWMPRVDIQETEKEYALSFSLPGVRKEDVKVEVQGDVLAVSGERRSEKEEKGRTWLRKETSYGSFQRRFVLPDGLHPEDVSASHKDGVLTITVRKPTEAKPKGVRISVG